MEPFGRCAVQGLDDEYWVPEHVREWQRSLGFSLPLEDMEPHIRAWDRRRRRPAVAADGSTSFSSFSQSTALVGGYVARRVLAPCPSQAPLRATATQAVWPTRRQDTSLNHVPRMRHISASE